MDIKVNTLHHCNQANKFRKMFGRVRPDDEALQVLTDMHETCVGQFVLHMNDTLYACDCECHKRTRNFCGV